MIQAASDHSLLVSFGSVISPEIHRKVLTLTRLLKDRRDALHIRNIHPAYSTVLVSFDPLRTGRGAMEAEIQGLLGALESVPAPAGRVVEIPVRYGGEEGPDLDDVARLNGLTTGEVIRLHTSAEYLVYFLGFSPGFPYLGGMSGRIATPRLERPRKLVPAGSVAIGGEQTGVYPLPSPGGWRIIGRTPLVLFSPAQDPPALLNMGDRVRFTPLS